MFNDYLALLVRPPKVSAAGGRSALIAANTKKQPRE
jgi:hypothetical protein